MTVSRIEAELVLLRRIADGDGEFIEIGDLRDRDAHILKDLRDAGMIEGQTYITGEADYRITSLGEHHLEQVERRLANEEAELAGKRKSAQPTRKLAAFLVSALAAIWFVFSEVLSPARICEITPKQLANWLSPCDEVVDGR